VAGGLATARAYDTFTDFATQLVRHPVFVGLTWAFWTKTFGGLRHLVMDIGAGFELSTNKFWSMIVVVLGIVFTVLTWAYIFWRAADAHGTPDRPRSRARLVQAGRAQLVS
jgi:succinate dehydrogenase / fumarate reductase cytochrome b subunit